MRDLDLARALHEVFASRGLHHVNGGLAPIRVAPAPGAIVIVRDLCAVRAILTSDAFESLDEFAPGLQRLARLGRPLPLIERFFAQGPLFLEGAAAREVRRSMLASLKAHTLALEADEARIAALMLARRHRLRSPLEFATLFVQICMTRMLQRLLGVGPRRALRALRLRRGVFYLHFHGPRLRTTEEALRQLAADSQTGDRSGPASTEELIAQSLLIMAYEPIVASLCAALLDGPDAGLGNAPRRYCPVSFITRVCVRDQALGSLELQAGDRCYLALAPTEDEPTAGRFPFGAGPHVCVGRHLSLRMLEMAERVIAAGGTWPFERTPRVAPDGAFLAFSDAPAETGQPV